MSSVLPPTVPGEQAPVYQNFIGGRWRAARSGETFASTNPANTQEIIGLYPKSSPAALGGDARAGTRRNFAAYRPFTGAAQRRTLHADDPRDGQNPAGDARRRADCH